MRAVPVFMYHHVNRHAGDLVTVSPEGFENHLRVLRDRNIRTLFLEELVQIFRGGNASSPAVVLTFDDGHLDNWVYAFPLLEKYRMKATVFVITSWLGEEGKRPRWNPEDPGGAPEVPRHSEAKKRAASGDRTVALTWEEARAMEASGLVDIQSHTHFHRDYFPRPGEKSGMAAPERELLFRDLAASKELIEARLGKKCRYLAWPWGKYDPEALRQAGELGFEATVTTEKGVNVPGSGEMAVRRIVAKSGEKRWFSTRLTIYSHRSLGRIYSRISGKI